MAWLPPKTDWVSTDFFNKNDYNRIKGNICFLKDYLCKCFDYVELEDMGDDKTYTSMYYADEINIIENNLETLNNGTFQKDIGETKTYFPNGNVPDFEEYNRIESALFEIYNSLNKRIISKSRIGFRLSMKGYGKLRPTRIIEQAEQSVSDRLPDRLGTERGGIDES